jgi:hypothetical protein
VLLVVLQVLTCLPALHGYFLSDDLNVLTGLEQHGTWSFALETPRVDGGRLGFFRPFPYLFLGLEFWMFGWAPLPWLVSGLLQHVGVSLLLFQWLRRRLEPVPLAIALTFFMLHPRLHELRFWVSAAPDVWATVGVLGVLLCLDRARLSPSSLWIYCSWMCAAVALLSKESALCLPFLVWWLDGEVERRRRLKRVVPHLLLVVAYLVARTLMIHDPVGAYGAEVHLRPSLVGALKPLTTLTLALLTPFHPGPELQPLILLLKQNSLLFLGLCLVLSVPTVVAAKHLWTTFQPGQRTVAASLLGAYGLSLLPLYNLTVTLEGSSERRLYLPALFFAGLLGLVLDHALRPLRQARPIALVIMLLLLTGGMFQRSRHYEEAGGLARAIIDETTRVASQSRGTELVLVGVPDKLNGIGLLSTGLPLRMKALLESRGKPVPRLSILARTQVWGRPEVQVRWTYQQVGTQRFVEGTAQSASTFLLEGGYGSPAFDSGSSPARRRHTQLRVPLEPGTMVYAVAGTRLLALQEPGSTAPPEGKTQ